MGSIAARTQSASPFSPAAGPRATPAGVPPPPRVFSRPRQLANAPRPPPPCSLPDDRPRQRSAPMAHRELASVPGHHCPRTRAAPPRSSSLLLAPPPIRPPPRSPPSPPSPSANWPTLAPPRSPLDPPSPSAPGAAPRPFAPTPTPARSGLLYGGAPVLPGACADGVAAGNGSPRPAASPSSHDPRRAAP